MKMVFTKEHRQKIGEARRKLCATGWRPYNFGLKTITRKNGKELLLKNMKAHLKYDVSLGWLSQFDDINKLKELNHLLARDRVSKNFDTEKYKQFIVKFYYDESFIKQYNLYLKTKDRWDRPSLDHIKPLSSGGNWVLENLQIVSWFENRAKCNLDNDKYNELVKKYYKGGD